MSTSVPVLTAPEYPADYIDMPFTTDEQTLADNAVLNLQATWAGWEPNDGDIEIVLIETLAPYATEAAREAASVPPAAFIALCTKLYGIPYQEGAPATTTVTLSFQDDAGGYYVPAGSEFDLSGYAFSTVLDVTSAEGATTATGVQVVANDVGVAFNGLTSLDWSSVTLPVWVSNLSTESATTGGVDAQDDFDYLNMASRELQLRGRMLVTCPDLEIAAVNMPGVGRAYAQTTGPRDVTVTLVDPNGEPVTTDVKAQLLATYQASVLVNVSFTLADATYTQIDVDYEVMRLPGFDSAQLRAAIDAELSTALSPTGWGTIAMGQPGSSLSTFVPDSTVRLNKVIAIIGNVVGVAYVVANSVQLNGTAADFVMPGTVAMPTPGVMTGIVDTPPAA